MIQYYHFVFILQFCSIWFTLKVVSYPLGYIWLNITEIFIIDQNIKSKYNFLLKNWDIGFNV